MSTSASTPGIPDDPDEPRDQPIDPTRTLDAYFEKQTTATAPTTPTQTIPDGERSESAQPESQPGSDRSGSDHFGQDHAEPTHPEPGYPEPGYPEPAGPEPTRPAVSQNVSPAAFTAPSATPPTAIVTTSPPVDPESGLRAVRMRTVVLGLVLLVIAGTVLVGQLTDITVDAGAVLLALMIGGGLLLIAGARRS